MPFGPMALCPRPSTRRSDARELLGYIEYPSHLEAGLDWPVGMAFRAELAAASSGQPLARPEVMGWSSRLPGEMHNEQEAFLGAHGLAT